METQVFRYKLALASLMIAVKQKRELKAKVIWFARMKKGYELRRREKS